MSGRSTSGMSWLKVTAPMAPTTAAAATMRLPVSSPRRAAKARAVSMNPSVPAAVSSTVRVGCRRNDSRVVPASVVTIDSSDQA